MAANGAVRLSFRQVLGGGTGARPAARALSLWRGLSAAGAIGPRRPLHCIFIS